MDAALEAICRQPDSLSSANLVRLVRSLRPAPGEPANARLLQLIAELQVHAQWRECLRSYFCNLLTNRETVKALTESGVVNLNGFFVEAYRRFKHQLLPLADPNRELGAMLRRVFSSRADVRWLQSLPLEHWMALIETLRLNQPGRPPRGRDGRADPVFIAARLLGYRIASLGLESELTDRLHHLDELHSPFLSLGPAVEDFFQGERTADPLEVLSQCETHVRYLRIYRNKHGTSLRLTVLTRRLRQQIKRLSLLVRLKSPEQETRTRALAGLAQEVVLGELQKNHLTEHVRESVRLLTYQVTEHTASTGHKYITTTGREYWSFLLRSMAGGLWVAIFASLKLKIVTLPLAPFWLAAALSLNYAACFVLIYLSGTALATKQPSMTASAVAQALDSASQGSDKMRALSELFVRVWRTQFISFLGNLLAAFPAALALFGLHQMLRNAPLITPDKAQHLLHDVHPFESGSLLFAGLAGIFLFLSGLITGYVDNKMVYSDVARRLRYQPRLRRLGDKRREKLARFADAKLGGIVGNVSLGIMLGSAATAGSLFGLPIDIRHIAFSAAHTANAIAALQYRVLPSMILVSLLGVLLIGLVNFLVSFSLALSLAMYSRKTTFSQALSLAGLVLSHALRRPWDFVLPLPTRARNEPADATVD